MEIPAKSALIQRLTESVGPAFRRQRIFQRRPHVLWPNGSLHAKGHIRKRSTWSAGPRLFALLVDYWLGYVLLIRPVLARSGLVVFDGYLNDLFEDPEPCRYAGPRWLVKAVSALIPTPHLIFDVTDDKDQDIDETIAKQSQLIAAYLAGRFQQRHARWLVPAATISERDVAR